LRKGFGFEKGIAGLLVLALLSLNGISFAKDRKKGAELLIQKNDGELIRGELIAVKPDSLLILGSGGVPTSPEDEVSVPDQSHPDRWRLGVHGPVRGSLEES
jgi:hypothetical protein